MSAFWAGYFMSHFVNGVISVNPIFKSIKAFPAKSKIIIAHHEFFVSPLAMNAFSHAMSEALPLFKVFFFLMFS